uniref:MGS-like domain-containing protein n=1 Tax=Fagus sylvatica TaxID=28930 RepID=A0A2N9H7N1_FAGSY
MFGVGVGVAPTITSTATSVAHTRLPRINATPSSYSCSLLSLIGCGRVHSYSLRFTRGGPIKSMADTDTHTLSVPHTVSQPSASGNKHALISLSDKKDLAYLGKGLQELGYLIVSTGGTASALESARVSVTKVEQLTCFPEMLDGRIKTLHPNIHGGILARRDQKHHMEALNKHGIGTFDVVVVNLYPFYDKVTSIGGIEFEDGIENIDIGGPAMIRAAAKNNKDVLVVVDPNDYPLLVEFLKGGGDDQHFRRRLAWKAFQHVASYDSAVAEWLWKQTSGISKSSADYDKFPPSLTVPLECISSLRYGENPHQKAAFYVDKRLAEVNAGGIATSIQHHGKDWELGSVTLFMDLIYSGAVSQGGDYAMCWTPSSRKVLEVKSFYNLLLLIHEKVFPWKSVWKPTVPSKVSFFLWTAALGRVLTTDNLWKQRFVGSGLFLVWGRLGDAKRLLQLLACWPRLSRRGNWAIRCMIPDCLVWGLWRERNARTFEGENMERTENKCPVTSNMGLSPMEMSYNNYLDADAAWNCVSEFRNPTCVVVKHTNPCGVASRDDILEAYRLAVKADPVSAFGGIVAFNVEIDEALAREIREFRSPTDGETRMFYEIVVAPKYSNKGLEILQKKSKSLRILEAIKNEKGKLSLRQVGGGWLAQDSDDLTPQDIQFNVVSEKAPQESELCDAEFAWLCVKHVKSNAIVIAKNNCMLGMGSGQPNRLESLRIALKKAGDEVKGAALASDAFFPFGKLLVYFCTSAWKDAVEEACENGVSVIAEPGGSIRDVDAIDCCNKYGVSLLFTNVRHFRH